LGNARDFTGTDRRLVIRHRDPERFCALWAAIAIRPREQVQDWIGAAVPRPRRYERAPGPARSGSRGIAGDDSRPRRQQHQLQPAVDVELLVDIVEVQLHRAFGDPQLLGDRPVPQARRHRPDDLQFARAQRGSNGANRRVLGDLWWKRT